MKRAAALAMTVALAVAAPAAAQCQKTTLGDIEDEVMCPVCGTPLSLATEAPQAERQRELIQRLIAQCRSKDDIKDVLAAQFGDRVLATPESNGFDAAAYIVPAVALLLAAGGIALAVRRWRGSRGGGGPQQPSSGAATARLDADIERYDL